MFPCLVTAWGFGLFGFPLVFKGWGTRPLELLSRLGWQLTHLLCWNPHAMESAPSNLFPWATTFPRRPGGPLSHSHRTPVHSKLYEGTIPTRTECRLPLMPSPALGAGDRQINRTRALTLRSSHPCGKYTHGLIHYNLVMAKGHESCAHAPGLREHRRFSSENMGNRS